MYDRFFLVTVFMRSVKIIMRVITIKDTSVLFKLVKVRISVQKGI